MCSNFVFFYFTMFCLKVLCRCFVENFILYLCKTKEIKVKQ